MGTLCAGVVFGTICPGGHFSCQNGSKIHQKMSKINEKLALDAKLHPEDIFNTVFAFLVVFWRPKGLPKWPPKRWKTQKCRSKNHSENHACSNICFHLVFCIFRIQNWAKSDDFLNLFENVDFVKNVVFFHVKSRFFMVRAHQIPCKIDWSMQSRNTTPKSSQKVVFWIDLG